MHCDARVGLRLEAFFNQVEPFVDHLLGWRLTIDELPILDVDAMRVKHVCVISRFTDADNCFGIVSLEFLNKVVQSELAWLIGDQEAHFAELDFTGVREKVVVVVDVVHWHVHGFCCHLVSVRSKILSEKNQFWR